MQCFFLLLFTQNWMFHIGFGVVLLIPLIVYNCVTCRVLRKLCISLSVCSCLFFPAAAQDVECVQSSNCLQGRTLQLYSV